MSRPLLARDEFGQCRALNHMWARNGLERHGSDVLLSLTCTSCGTIREDMVNLATGDVDRHYAYAKDYVQKLEGEARPYKGEYRREWLRTILQEETGRLIRLPSPPRRAAARRRTA